MASMVLYELMYYYVDKLSETIISILHCIHTIWLLFLYIIYQLKDSIRTSRYTQNSRHFHIKCEQDEFQMRIQFLMKHKLWKVIFCTKKPTLSLYPETLKFENNDASTLQFILYVVIECSATFAYKGMHSIMKRFTYISFITIFYN